MISMDTFMNMDVSFKTIFPLVMALVLIFLVPVMASRQGHHLSGDGLRTLLCLHEGFSRNSYRSNGQCGPRDNHDPSIRKIVFTMEGEPYKVKPDEDSVK